MQNELILPNYKETVYGRRYLLFQMIFLGSFLSLALQIIGIPVNAAQLNLLYFAVNFVVTVLLLRKFLCQSVGFGLHNLGKSLLWTAVFFAAYQFLMTLVGMIVIAIEPDFANVNDQNIAAIGKDNFAIMAIGTVLLVPTAEELLHRGIVFGGLYRRNRVAAYAVSTVLFCLIHVSGYIGTAEPLILGLCFLQYVPAGLCLAAAYERSGSILTPILIHTAVNALGMMAMR